MPRALRSPLRSWRSAAPSAPASARNSTSRTPAPRRHRRHSRAGRRYSSRSRQAARSTDSFSASIRRMRRYARRAGTRLRLRWRDRATLRSPGRARRRICILSPRRHRPDRSNAPGSAPDGPDRRTIADGRAGSSVRSRDAAAPRSAAGNAGSRAAAVDTFPMSPRRAGPQQATSPPRRASSRAGGTVAGGGRSPSFRLSIDVFGFEQRDEGAEDDPDVEPQRPMVDVVDVQLHALMHAVDGGRLAAMAGNLGPAGDAWFHAMARGIFVDDGFDRFAAALFPQIARLAPHRMRPRPHQRHVALQDVEDLGQLVEAPAPQERADLGNARILAPRLLQRLILGGGDAHGAELVDRERQIVEAKPVLAEEHRPAAGQLDCDGNAGEQRREP